MFILGKMTLSFATRDKRKHHITIKRSIHQEDIIIIYPPNIIAPKYIKQILTELNRNIQQFNNSRSL